MPQNSESAHTRAEFVPTLREAVASLDPAAGLSVALPVKGKGELAPGEREEVGFSPGVDRTSVFVSDGASVALWKVDSLRALFRGDRQPPILGDYPAAYADDFHAIEGNLLDLARELGDPSDTEMKEIYSILRRRPDGKSLGFVHDFLWQTTALMMGMRPVSEAEFGAIVGRLEKSCRTFEMGPSSRNYLRTLRTTVGQMPR